MGAPTVRAVATLQLESGNYIQGAASVTLHLGEAPC